MGQYRAMNKFRSYMLTAVGFVVLVSAFSMAAPTTTTAAGTTTDTKAVLVTNTVAEPVPVQGAVAVTNTPTVNAKQSGPWAVALGGPVQVENTAANPLNVREVATPLQTVMVHGNLDGNTSRSATLYTVPAGKRLVLQYLNVDAIVDTDSAEWGVSTSVQAVLTNLRNGIGHQYNIHLQQGAVFDNQRGGFFHFLNANQPVTFYFDAGTELGFGKFASSQTQLTVAFSGYLIDAN